MFLSGLCYWLRGFIFKSGWEWFYSKMRSHVGSKALAAPRRMMPVSIVTFIYSSGALWLWCQSQGRFRRKSFLCFKAYCCTNDRGTLDHRAPIYLWPIVCVAIARLQTRRLRCFNRAQCLCEHLWNRCHVRLLYTQRMYDRFQDTIFGIWLAFLMSVLSYSVRVVRVGFYSAASDACARCQELRSIVHISVELSSHLSVLSMTSSYQT